MSYQLGSVAALSLKWLGLCAAACLAAVILTDPAAADRRVALVIGNGAYANVPKLTNPPNDAVAVAALLRTAGFDLVEIKTDLGVTAMRKALRDFSAHVRSADVAVVFYAGHGIELNGINHLIPIDATLASDIDVEDESVTLDRVVKTLEQAKRLQLVILDACRDNPFTRSMKRSAGVRSVRSGHAQIDEKSLPSNTLIAYAQRAGSTADDGSGVNSPYTVALLKHLATPGLDVELALRRVRDEVLVSTSNKQEPFKYGSLGGAELPLVAESKVITRQALTQTTNQETPRISLIVLPFSNIGDQQDQPWFADALTDSITTDLSRIAGSMVIARNTAFTLKPGQYDVRSVGREFGVRYALEGTILRSGDTVRLNVKLLDTESRTQVWTERFEGSRANLFDLQDQITTFLAGSLKVELVRAAARRGAGLQNPVADDIAMQGLAVSYLPQSRDSLEKAGALFRRALSADAENQTALVGLGRALAFLAINFDTQRTQEGRAKLTEALDLAERALRFDSASSAAYAVRALGLQGFDKPLEAIENFMTAIRLNPNSADSYSYVGRLLAAVGEPEEAIRLMSHCLRINPKDPDVAIMYSQLGIANLAAGKTDDAIEWWEKSRASNPKLGYVYPSLAAAYALAGKPQKARDTISVGLTVNPKLSLTSYKRGAFVDHPFYNSLRERMYAALKDTGIPE